MRILHVVPSYLPAVRYGGPIYSVNGLARASAARGHDVHVFTTNVDGPCVSPVPLARPIDLDGVKVWYFSCGLGRRIYRSPDMAKMLEREVRHFDIVHLHSVFLWPTNAAAHAARKHGVPYVLAPRGMLVEGLIASKSRWTKTLWIRLFERKNVAYAGAIHVTSEIEKTELQNLGLPVKVFAVIPNGIELPPTLPPPSNDSGRPVILFLGRINWKKGLQRLIKSMVHVPGADLVIAGNDEDHEMPKLRELVTTYALEGRVRFVGPQHGNEKWALITSAAVFATASYSENFGIAVLEAMACGVPVVVTPEVGLASAIIKNGAGVVVDGEPAAFGKALADLIKDPQRRAALGSAGRKAAAEQFSWDAIARDIEAIYATTLREHLHNA